MFERVPQYPPNQRPPKMQRKPIEMRGPEFVHNKLQYCEFGIQVRYYSIMDLNLQSFCDQDELTFCIFSPLSGFNWWPSSLGPL